MKLKDGTYLYGATHHAFPIPTEDDAYGPVWILVEPCGHFATVRAAVRCATFDDAWQLAIDIIPSIPAEDVHEAYGFDDPDEFEAHIRREEGDWPDLVEGYYYQDGKTHPEVGITYLDPGWQVFEYDPRRHYPDVVLDIRHIDFA